MESSPGLLRIICIDAHIASKRMEVKLPHHSNISGSNGSGKTTLLKLVPFFYGATPSELVERVGKKTNFTDYYLSRPTSLIIFEYMTPRGCKCVVVYRHTSGQKPAYRFLDEPFSVDYFSEERDGQPYFIEGRNLGRHWTTLRLTHSNQLDVVTDYRAVIQGDRSLINRSNQSRELMSLVAMYGLGGRIGSMGHINKMTAAILSRRGSMEGIKQMIAEIMREDQIELPPLKLHKSVRDVVSELAVLRNLEKEKSLFREVVSLGISHVENHQALYLAGAELHRHSQLIQKQKAELNSQMEQNRERLKIQEDQWEENSRAIKGHRQDSEIAQQRAERTLEDLDKTYEFWLEQDIQRKQADYKNLGEFEEQLRTSKQHRRALEEGIQDLKQHYDELSQTELQRYRDKERKLIDQQIKVTQDKNSAEKEWLEKRSSIQAEKHRALAKHLQQRTLDEQQLVDKVTEARFSAEKILPTEEETLALAAAEYQRDQAEQQLEQAKRLVEHRESTVRRLSDEATQANNDLSSAKRLREQQQSECDRLFALCNPKPGSLLSELRNKDSNWPNTLGKIMREELLERNDLDPVFAEGQHQNLLGWSLNLEKLDKPQWAASQEEHEQRLAAQEQQLALAEQHCEEKQSRCNKALKVLKAAQDERDEAKRLSGQDARRYETARETVRTVKANNQQAANERKRLAGEQLKQLQQSLAELKQQIQDEQAAIEQRFSNTINEAFGQHSSHLTLLDEELTIIEESIGSEKSRHEEASKAIQREFKQQCTAKGMDDKLLDAAIKHEKEAQQAIDRVNGYRQAVQKYEDWYEKEWPLRGQYEAKRTEAEQQFAKFDMQLKDAERNYKEERNELNRYFNQWRGQLNSATDRLDACIAALKKAELSWTAPHSEIDIKPDNDLRELNLVLADVDSLLTAQQQIIKKVRSGIGRVESVIASQGDNNQISEAWHQLRRQAEAKLTDNHDSDALNINLTQSLDELIRVQLPQKIETIESFVRTISDQLADFYLGLRQVSRLIKRQSRDISNSISATRYFSAIGSIGVSLNSRIDSLDYWPHLESFEQSYREWKASGDSGLPPKQLDEQLITVTDILHRSQIAKGIESVFDLEISLEENGRIVTVTNSRDLENASSNGLSYLILCSIFAGITRMLCRDQTIRIHWPVDELGVIDSVNIASLFHMLNDHNIVMVGGFPTTDPLLLQHFTDRHEMRKGEGLVDIQLPEDKLTALMAERRKRAVEETSEGASV